MSSRTNWNRSIPWQREEWIAENKAARERKTALERLAVSEQLIDCVQPAESQDELAPEQSPKKPTGDAT